MCDTCTRNTVILLLSNTVARPAPLPIFGNPAWSYQKLSVKFAEDCELEVAHSLKPLFNALADTTRVELKVRNAETNRETFRSLSLMAEDWTNSDQDNLVDQVAAHMCEDVLKSVALSA